MIFSLPFTTLTYIPYQAIAQNKTIIPIANAGSNQTIKSGTTVTLDGSASRDPSGNKLNYYWTQIAGRNATLSAIRIANPTFTAPYVTSPAVLKFRLIVDNGKLSSLPNTVSIAVQPQNYSPPSSTTTMPQQVMVQPNNSNEAANILAGLAIQALQNKDTNKALVHLNILNQQLASMADNSSSIQSAKVLADDATQALKNDGDTNKALVLLNLINQQLVPNKSSTPSGNTNLTTKGNTTIIPIKHSLAQSESQLASKNITDWNNGYRDGFSKGQSDYNVRGYTTPYYIPGSSTYQDAYELGYHDAYEHPTYSLKPGICTEGSNCLTDQTINQSAPSGQFTNPSTTTSANSTTSIPTTGAAQTTDHNVTMIPGVMPSSTMPKSQPMIAHNMTYNDGYKAGFSKGQSDFNTSGKGYSSPPEPQGSQLYVNGYNAGYPDGWAQAETLTHPLKPGDCSLSMCIADPSTNHQPTSAPLFTNPSTTNDCCGPHGPRMTSSTGPKYGNCYDEHGIVVGCIIDNGSTNTTTPTTCPDGSSPDANDNCPAEATTSTNITGSQDNITRGGNMTSSQDNTTTSIPIIPSQGNMTEENVVPSEATQSPPNSGVDWMSICTTVQPALYPSCDTLVNSDGTLTPEGQHAVDCIRNGALLAGSAMAAGSAYGVPVPPSLIAKGLSILAAPTGCGGIVKMDQINNVANAAGGLGALSHLIP